MKIINVGMFNCEFCKKDISVTVHANDPELVMQYKDEAIAWAKNYHWYDNHYNCAVCGKWIPSDERELVFEKDFQSPIHKNYNFDVRTGLMRVHKKCIDKGGES